MTGKREAFIKEKLKDPLASNAEIARRAGYAPANAKVQANQLMNDERIAKKINGLGEKGLDGLERIVDHGKNEIAVATAAKTLVETAYGKPKDNKSTHFGDITINIAKIDPQTIKALASQPN